MEKDKDFLGTEPIGKLLFRLAIPTLAAQLINMLYNVVDRIYIGHIPKVGALALTGVGVCMPLIMIVSAFAVLVGNGGAPRASIYMGQNNKEDAEKTLGNCFATQILVAVILTITLLLGNRTFLLAFGASENTISYATAYMNIYAIGTIFVQLTLGLNAFITAQGFAKTGMLSVLIGAVINIVLDPIFIFGFHMGVRGAALATVVSQACSCIWVVSFLFGKKTFLKIKRKNMLQLLTVKIWRRHCGRCDDNSDQCHAVRNVATAGTWTGSTADTQLQLWRKKCRPRSRNISPAAEGQCGVCRDLMAVRRIVPADFCRYVHIRRGIACI